MNALTIVTLAGIATIAAVISGFAHIIALFA